MNPKPMWPDRSPRGEVGLADVLLASVALGVRGGREAQWLAGSLGLAWSEAASLRPGDIHAEGGSEGAGHGKPDPREKATETKEEPRKLTLLDPVRNEQIAFERIFEADVDKIRQSAELRPATSQTASARPRFQPLFLERWFQGIFTAVLGTQVWSREIDFRKLERSLVRDEELRQLPLKPRSSLVKGVQVLLDHSESMQPFWRDQVELVGRLQRLLGDDLVQQSWFDYDALRPASSRITWQGPMPRQFRKGVPVLIVTDFGSGLDPMGGRTVDWAPWEPIFQQAANSGCRVLALIAAPSEYWPVDHARVFDGCFSWDRGTSPHTATKRCPR